jgi:hypothetical protein
MCAVSANHKEQSNCKDGNILSCSGDNGARDECDATVLPTRTYSTPVTLILNAES